MNENDLITSSSNDLVKQVRALRRGKIRAQTGTFLVEGLHHVGSALEAGWQVDIVLHAPDLLEGDFAARLLEDARRGGVILRPVTARIMEGLAEKDHPQGILAIVRQKTTDLEQLDPFQNGVALVTPQDPGNVGTILRTVEATGAQTLFLLDGGVDLFHPTLVRASMGALFWIPVVHAKFSEFADWAKVGGVKLIGSSAHADQDYQTAGPLEPPWVLVLGSEQKGLSPEQLALCDLCLSIPMRGHESSLNLAVATGVLLYSLKIKPGPSR